MVYSLLNDCNLCPRECHINRTGGQTGYCGQTNLIKIARASLHMWEEPCISGDKGSGTVFFSGCSLKCVYCQNHNIANGLIGYEISENRLAEICCELQQKGAHNINLVTADHFIPQIIFSLKIAKKIGLVLPVVYNCSGYTKVESIKLLEGYVDIYLPDFKYIDSSIGKKYSNCPDYYIYASKAIKEMLRQTGKPVFDSDGIMKKGVIVRHLMLPGCLKDSKRIIKYLFESFGNNIYISIMNQYTPLPHVCEFVELTVKISTDEYNELVDYAISLGIENGFIQEGDTASESFIPDFNGEGI